MRVLDLDRIRERNEPIGFHIDQDDVRLLLAEIERLRKIEDAARTWDKARAHEMEDAVDDLQNALDANPRPEPQS